LQSAILTSLILDIRHAYDIEKQNISD